MLVDIKISDIVSHGNVRVETGDVTTLAASIAATGLIQPITVVATDDESGTYVLVAGHRRVAACKELGFTDIDAIISDAEDPVDVIKIQYHENMERKDLSAYEQAQVAWDLKVEGLNQAGVAEVMGIPKAQVATMHKTAKHMADVKPTSATQLSAQGLFDVVDGTTPAQAGDVVRLILEGEHVRSAISKVEREDSIVTFYDEIAEAQKVWFDEGIKVMTDDPRKVWNKTNDYNQAINDPNVQLVKDIGFTDKAHIEQVCHRVWIHADVSGWQTPTVSHWCADIRQHKTTAKKAALGIESKKLTAQREFNESTSLERRAKADLKRGRIEQTQLWMRQSDTAGIRELVALDRAVSLWRHEHTRGAIVMLGLLKTRPKGADFNWYDVTLDSYLDEKFGDNTLKRDRWKVKFLVGFQYIEGGFGMDDTFMSILTDVALPDGE